MANQSVTTRVEGMLRLCLLLVSLFLCLVASAQEEKPVVYPNVVPGSGGPSYYLIGNSLTWDTVPSKLDGDVQWHVDCGKSLPFIYENPGSA